MLSLRARVLVGAVLWTAGLFTVSGIVLIFVMNRHPSAPGIFHSLFAHSVATGAAALLMMLAGFWQVRKGLGPFHRLRDQLSGVREDGARRIEGLYPPEVQPLVSDLNALLEHREQAVRRALAKAGDLAHGLKTPLAVLSQEAERAEAAGHVEIANAINQQIERMRRQVDYHLAHARAAASGASSGARCHLVASVEGLSRTLQRLHADRGLTIHTDVPPEHIVRSRREDLDEMLGNLLDNAAKWARSRVSVASVLRDGVVVVTVDDDGPGLAASMREHVLTRGVRADEAAPGSGFGLAIVRDLAEVYGGSIALGSAPSGGLRAQLELPCAPVF